MKWNVDRKTHINFWYIVLAMMLTLTAQAWWERNHLVETIPHSQFQALLDNGKLQEIGIFETNIRGMLKEPVIDGHEYIETVRIEPEFAKETLSAGELPVIQPFELANDTCNAVDSLAASLALPRSS